MGSLRGITWARPAAHRAISSSTRTPGRDSVKATSKPMKLAVIMPRPEMARTKIQSLMVIARPPQFFPASSRPDLVRRPKVGSSLRYRKLHRGTPMKIAM